MVRHWALTRRQVEPAGSARTGQPFRITGWDVDPHEGVHIEIGTPGRPTPARSPRIQIRLERPETTETPVRVGRGGSLLRTRGRHSDGESTMIAVPEAVVTGDRLLPRAENPLSSSWTHSLAPGDSITRVYELVPGDQKAEDGHPAGAYTFETDVSVGTECSGLTVWLSRSAGVRR